MDITNEFYKAMAHQLSYEDSLRVLQEKEVPIDNRIYHRFIKGAYYMLVHDRAGSDYILVWAKIYIKYLTFNKTRLNKKGDLQGVIENFNQIVDACNGGNNAKVERLLLDLYQGVYIKYCQISNYDSEEIQELTFNEKEYFITKSKKQEGDKWYIDYYDILYVSSEFREFQVYEHISKNIIKTRAYSIKNEVFQSLVKVLRNSGYTQLSS